jgi:hypothetical protein
VPKQDYLLWGISMKLIPSCLSLAAVLVCDPASAKSVQKAPPPDEVNRIEQGYWNLMRRENNLPEDAAFSGAQVIKCKNLLGKSDKDGPYTQLLGCSVRMSYSLSNGSTGQVSTKTNYGADQDGLWSPVLIGDPASMPLIGVAK